ncbi:alpha/beta fold hydrolase [Myxococcus sp. CA040A]|uniref:alpha/beta fold hydrolase n=1 Tax=Myxococcus sp. CA040A TaxID=2741738 RepID=UPI00157B83BB|nr:alpha/beta fold hydrolase [Myxococcus sp. CA040A]NTX04603.1 alpha/beta fold hydrolase [Myxococcus sp. CA040A]
MPLESLRPNAPMTWTRPHILHLLQSGLRASVPTVLLATLAMEARPHAHGLSFFPELRYAVLAPVYVLVAVLAAFGHGWLTGRVSRPRSMLATATLGLALVLLLGMAVLGRDGLAVAALPAFITVAFAVAWLAPRAVEQPSRSRVRTVALVLLGTLEAAGVVTALAGEHELPHGPESLVGEIPRAMFDAEHRFVDLPSGARIHYVDEGTGDTLLFLHGNPSWSFQWRDLIRGLRGSYRCVALDYPGFGLSTAPPGFGFTPGEQSRVLEEFAEHLGLRDVTLVMQDWGGPIGTHFAARRPELVQRVILGSTWAWKTSTSEPRGMWSVIAGGPIGAFAQHHFNAIASFGLKDSIVRELPRDVRDVYLRPFQPLERRGIATFYPGQITKAHTFFEEVEAGLPALVHKPALIFWALDDPGFPQADRVRWEQTFPSHHTIELANAHHFFFEDHADTVVSEIRAFMSSELARNTTVP